MRISFGLASLVSMCAVVTSLVGAHATSAQTYDVVELASYTGAAQSIIVPAAQGFEAYIDYVNRNGGVNGRQINLLTLDDQSTPSVGSVLLQRAIAEEPIAIAHMGASVVLTQNRAILEGITSPILSCCIDDSFMYPTPQKNAFSMNLTASQSAHAMVNIAEELLGDLQGKKIAIALTQTSYWETMILEIERLAEEKGFEIVEDQRFNLGVPSFSSQALRIARAKPDAVLVAAIEADAPVVVGAISDAGVSEAPIVGFSAMSSGALFLKLDLPNYFAYRPYELATEVAELKDEVGATYQESMQGSLWSLGWAIGVTLVNAIDKCDDDCTGEKLIEVLESADPLEVPGILYGPVKFGTDDHAGLSAIQLYTLKDGAVVMQGDPINVAE